MSPVVGWRLGSGTEAWALPARAEIRVCLPPPLRTLTRARRPREHERAARGRQGGDAGQGVRGQDKPGGTIRARPLPGGALSERECAARGPARVGGSWPAPTALITSL